MNKQARTRTNRPWSDADLVELDRLWAKYGGRIEIIADQLGRTVGSIAGKSRVRHLHFHGEPARPLDPGSSAVLAAKTVFPQTLRQPEPGVLKSGDNQRKLGGKVTKGPWAGMPIYSLTLEERATCPRSCIQFRACYGNQMGRAARYRHGPELERQVAAELGALQVAHPGGFVVRLHILGDFYSEAYVCLWRQALATFPALRVFGYTAWPETSVIGAAIAALRERMWDRFAIRTSGAKTGPRTVVIGHLPQGKLSDLGQRMKTQLLAKAGHPIVCPAQTGGTSHCGACAICWAPAARHRPIAFIAH